MDHGAAANLNHANGNQNGTNGINGDQKRLKAREYARMMVDRVRGKTDLSYNSSLAAVKTVIEFLNKTEGFSGNYVSFNDILRILDEGEDLHVDVSQMSQNTDARRLKELFFQLTECKNDEQQRSWAVHEDEKMIIELIMELNQILSNADEKLCSFVMEKDRYAGVNALALYYQMESRWSIRQNLLNCFSYIICCDQKAHSVLFNSVLPMELARELREIDSYDRMRLVVRVLSLVIANDERLPITHRDLMGVPFVKFLLEQIEDPHEEDETDGTDHMNLLMLYNYKFAYGEENLVVKALEEVHLASKFTQKLISRLNDHKDDIWEVACGKTNGMKTASKMAIDLMSSPTAASLFYTNDIKVLIDVLTRFVTDLGPDEGRQGYIVLIHHILKNTNYDEHEHRIDDLRKAFQAIMSEEDPHADSDKLVLSYLIDDYPQYFGDIGMGKLKYIKPPY